MGLLETVLQFIVLKCIGIIFILASLNYLIRILMKRYKEEIVSNSNKQSKL